MMARMVATTMVVALMLNPLYFGPLSDTTFGSYQEVCGGDDRAQSRADAVANWTLVYILAADNGESDGPSYYMAKDRLEEVGSSDDVNALLITDGYPNKPLEADTEFWYIKEGAGNSIPISLNQINPGWIDEINTGDPKTFIDIEKYCRENFPSKYMQFVIRTDAFFSTIAPDYTSDDELTTAELKEAFAGIKENRGEKNVDIITLSTCNTAMTEWFYQISPYADYCLASEDRSTGRYWQLEEWLDFLNNAPGTTPKELCEHIVSDYLDPSKEKWDPSKKCTVSAIDLQEFPHLCEAVNELGLVLIKKLATHSSEIQLARDETEAVDESKRLDLYSLANHLHNISDSDIKEAAKKVKESFNETIVAQGSYLFGDAHGIAIYFPLTAADYDQFISMYSSRFQFSNDAYWADFLQSFFSGYLTEPLEVETSLSADTILSGTQATLSVFVTASGQPQSGAEISLSCERGGTLTPASGASDPFGSFSSTFTSPVISQERDFVFTVTATAPGKLGGHGFSIIKVETLKPLEGFVNFNTSLEPGDSSEVEVLVKSGDEVIGNVDVMLNVTLGSVTPLSGRTDGQGIFNAVYTAPLVNVEVSDALKVNVSKAGYMGWDSIFDVDVIPTSVLRIVAESSPKAVALDGTSTITITVYDGDLMVPGASISIDVEPDGECIPSFGETNRNGLFSTFFNAPTQSETGRSYLNITATKDGYPTISSKLELMLITPPRFDFEYVITPDKISSAESATILITTIYGARPLPDVNVALLLGEGLGQFASKKNMTNEMGYLEVEYLPPDVESESQIPFVIQLSKPGYETMSCEEEIAVSPRPKVLEINFPSEIDVVEPGTSLLLKIEVTSGGEPVPSSSLVLTCSMGKFIPEEEILITSNTDGAGEMSVEYLAPDIREPTVVSIIAVAGKAGFGNGSSTLMFTVSSEGPNGEDDERGGEADRSEEEERNERLITIGFFTCVMIVFGFAIALKISNHKKMRSEKREERLKNESKMESQKVVEEKED